MLLADLHEPLLPILAELVRWADWPVGGRVLDGGCGPGLKTSLLATALGPQGTLIGLDWDCSALHAANATIHSETGRTYWLAGDLALLPLANATIDGVWCNAVVGLLGDRAAALAAFRRVLRPAGSAVIVTGTQCWAAVNQWPPDVAQSLAAAYERIRTQGMLPHHELGDGLATQLREAGFHHVATRAFLIDPTAHTAHAAELALLPWATVRPLLAPLLDAATMRAADDNAAALDDVDLVSILIGAWATHA